MRIAYSKRVSGRRQTAGTSLVELLVVMVIFLLGMLAMMQVFPGGLRILRENRNTTMAMKLASSQLESIKGRADQLPEMIVPVMAYWTGSGVALQADATRPPNELGPVAAALDPNGNLLDGSNNILGPWQLLSGANVTRRVIGEGGVIPAPRPVGSVSGGLLLLQFAPVVPNSDPSVNFPEYFEVYGNDMLQRDGDPTFGRVRPYEYYTDHIDDPAAAILLPRDTVQTRHYRVSASAIVNNGTANIEKDIVSATIVTVPADPSGGFLTVPLGPIIVGSGESLVSVDPNSLRVARLFEPVTSWSGDPYEYMMLDKTLGLVLFSPAGYNFKVRQGGGMSVPLVGRVDYDVLDWRIIREELRAPDADRPFYQLSVGNLSIVGHNGPDGRPISAIPVTRGTPLTNTPNVVVMDMATGAIVLPSSLQVDGSRGIVTFVDGDADATNGIQVQVVYPDGSNGTLAVTGRSVRVMYTANGEWTVQVMKAPSVYRLVYGLPGIAQYYVGGTNTNLTNPGLPTRIYFAQNDAGKKVSIETINYVAGGVTRQLQAQDFVIQTKPADAVGLPFVDITTADPGATSFDFSVYGYAVKNVKGASVSVRALWNPAYFALTSDPAENLRRFNIWLSSWRASDTETYLQRSVN